MLILGFNQIKAFKSKHANSRTSLSSWETDVQIAQWQNIEEIRRDFKSVDYIPFRDLYCFDLKGNKIRLIAAVNYQKQTLYVKESFTQAEYDKWNKAK